MAAPLSLGIEVVGDGIADRRVGVQNSAGGVAELARKLESAGVDYWVIGAERGEAAPVGRQSLDPSLIATVAARSSTDLGLVVAAAGHRDHPYNLARRLVSVDHAAQGRVGWLALDFDHGIALNAARDSWTGADLEVTHTDDAVDAVRTLWRTWPLDAVVGDTTAGVFSDVTRIRRADVRRGYAIAGPLNVPGSVQGDLPIWRHGATHAADLVVVEDGAPVPDGVPAVVRVRAAEAIDAALERISRIPTATGALLRLTPGVLDRVLGRLIPAVRRRGVLAEPGTGTLRARLGLPVPDVPDITAHPHVFGTAPNPGGRL
ncbi:luciferase [Mycobacterium sp. C31M]